MSHVERELKGQKDIDKWIERERERKRETEGDR
jgi:hypothetical protein